MSPEILTLGDAAIYGIVLSVLIALCAVLLSSHRTLDRSVFAAVVVVMLAMYAIYRLSGTLPEFAWAPYALWPRAYAVLEMTVLLYTALSVVFFIRRTDRSAQADEAEGRLSQSEDPPAVDIFICTYSEDLIILERSILAALAIDYPNFTVWVLDDGQRNWLRDYCESVGARYVRRDDNVGAKGGNLDNGIRLSAQSTNAPLIMVLDADFAPQRNILRRIVGLFEDESVGVVQTPQFYYNADPIQHNLLARGSWVDDQRIFFDVMQPSKDAWGAAFCVGTSFVVRREALQAIGGMPKETVTEDLHLTYRLLKRGLRTIWLNERLSVGLSAESLAAYVTQRCRWCLGTIQIALLPDGPMRSAGYSLLERIHFFHGLLFWLCRPFVVALLLAPILFYFLGLPAMLISPEALLVYGLPAVLGSAIFHAWVSGKRALPLFTEVNHMLTAFPVTYTILKAIRRPFGHPFKVTAKGEDRSDVQVQVPFAILFATIIVLTIVGMVNGPLLRTYGEHDGFSVAWGLVIMIYSFVALLTCIELPRRELDDELFPVDKPGTLRWADGAFDANVAQASLKELAFDLPKSDPPLAIGDYVEVVFLDGLEWWGQISEVTRRSVTVRLLDPDPIRSEMIIRLFARAPINVATQGRMIATLLALLRRMLSSPNAITSTGRLKQTA